MKEKPAHWILGMFRDSMLSMEGWLHGIDDMAYSKADFQIMKERFRQALFAKSGEPLSCELYEAPFAHGAVILESDDGEQVDYHVAEACNIAAVITSVGRILSLPRSEVACEEMSEVLLLRLDVLREYIRATIETAQQGTYVETEDDKTIRRWAGFLKHPAEYVFAHRCLSYDEAIYDSPTIDIDCNFLANWDHMKPRDRDRMKADLAHRIVAIKLPGVSAIGAFFASSAAHINQLVNANHLDGRCH